MKGDGEGTAVLGGRYRVHRQVRGSLGGGRVTVGTRGTCRFCHRGPGATFRKVAHAIPEALGNKWVVSLDECDNCNELFSRYEGALADAVAPLLTLGGTRGKGNAIRQTGRSKGSSVLTRVDAAERPRISMFAQGFDTRDVVSVDPRGRLVLNMPIAGVPFRPRNAYKALCKIAYGIMPEADLPHYDKLRRWLQTPDDGLHFPFLDVGLSTGSVGNAPPLAVATLLRRVNPRDVVPNLLFILCAGSVCLQIDLMSDDLEEHVPPVAMGAVNIKWANVIADEEGLNAVRIDYGSPVHLDWAGYGTEPQPIERVKLSFDTRTTEADLEPVMRRPRAASATEVA